LADRLKGLPKIGKVGIVFAVGIVVYILALLVFSEPVSEVTVTTFRAAVCVLNLMAGAYCAFSVLKWQGLIELLPNWIWGLSVGSLVILLYDRLAQTSMVVTTAFSSEHNTIAVLGGLLFMAITWIILSGKTDQ